MAEIGDIRGGALLRTRSGPSAVQPSAGLEASRPAATSPGLAGSVEIPTERTGSWVARATLAQPHGAVAEHFRHFALRLLRALEARGARSVAATSALRGEGKTTVSCNVALALAMLGEGRRVALVDLDLRRPRIAAALGVETKVGIESVLADATPLESARLATQLPSLDLYLARQASPAANGLFGSAAAAALSALTERYDLVVVDTPPVLLVPDAALLLPHLAAYFSVVRLGVTRRVALARALQELPEEKRLGAFVNEMPRPRYYHHYGYYSVD